MPYVVMVVNNIFPYDLDFFYIFLWTVMVVNYTIETNKKSCLQC
jgi:hypothetical protein